MTSNRRWRAVLGGSTTLVAAAALTATPSVPARAEHVPARRRARSRQALLGGTTLASNLRTVHHAGTVTKDSTVPTPTISARPATSCRRLARAHR